MQGDRRHGAVDVGFQAVDAVRQHALAGEEMHRMALAAADIEHGADGETLDQVAPQPGGEGVGVAVADIAAEILTRLVDDNVHFSLRDVEPWSCRQ